MKIDKKVFVNNTSVITAAGCDEKELFENILSGNTGIKRDSNYFYNSAPAIGVINSNKTFEENIIMQCQKILDDSNLDSFEDTLLVVGSSVGGISTTEKVFFETKHYKNIKPHLHNINSIAYIIKKRFSFYDDISFSTACTSSSNALGYAYEVLSKGVYKNVLVVGADSLSKTTVGGFLSLGVLSSNPCRPFDIDRNGMNVSEGIACLLLQNEKTKDSIELCGVGYSSDSYHITNPHPNGEGAINAMKNALKCANLDPSQINYINAHGTGTVANDNAEAKAIYSLFSNKPFVSSTKSITGHTLGASGAIEAIISCLVIKNKLIPKNTFLTTPENNEIKLVKENVKYEDLEYVLSNSFAFGGNNCSLIFGEISEN